MRSLDTSNVDVVITMRWHEAWLLVLELDELLRHIDRSYEPVGPAALPNVRALQEALAQGLPHAQEPVR